MRFRAGAPWRVPERRTSSSRSRRWHTRTATLPRDTRRVVRHAGVGSHQEQRDFVGTRRAHRGRLTIKTHLVVGGKGYPCGGAGDHRVAVVAGRGGLEIVATGDPQPGNRNDCTVYRESGVDQQLAGGRGRRLPRRARGDHPVPQTRARRDLNTVHRRVRARVEHAIGQMKTWKILRVYLPSPLVKRGDHLWCLLYTAISGGDWSCR